jgi:hypothetical protein
MESSCTWDIDRVLQLRLELQQSILDSIREFEETTGCHVESVNLADTLHFGYPARVHSVNCRVVL